MTRAALYCRISHAADGDRAGVDRQEQDCRRVCELRGWEVAAVHIDNSRSAWKRNRQRPGWDALLAGLAARSYDAVVVYHGDRLIRQPRDLEDLLDIAERGVQLTSPTGQRDLADPDDRFILRIEAAHACRSSDDQSRRLRRKHVALAAEGREPGGGSRPFGYGADRHTIDDAEAALVHEAADRLLAGETLRGICADWTARGVATVSGRPWTTTVLRRVLTNPRTAGQRAHKGIVTAAGTWPAILDDVTSHRLRALLLDPARRINRSPRRYLLTGLLVCGHGECGAKMVARPKADKRRAYVCAAGPGFVGCGAMSVLAEPVEAEVAARLFAAVDQRRLVRAASLRRDGGAEAELVAAVNQGRERLKFLASQWAGGLLDALSWETARAEVEQRMARASRQLAEVSRPPSPWTGRGADLAAAWDGLSFDLRRAVLVAFVADVVLSSAVRGRNRFDPSRVSVGWREG